MLEFRVSEFKGLGFSSLGFREGPMGKRVLKGFGLWGFRV